MILSLVCENAAVLWIFYYVNLFRKLVFIVLPIALIIILMLKLYRSLVVNGEDVFKEIGSYVQKLGALIIVFFIPSIIITLVSWISSDTINTYRECNENATISKIEYYQVAYEQVEKVNELITRLEKNPTRDSYEEAEKAVKKLQETYDINGEICDDLYMRLVNMYDDMETSEQNKALCEKRGGVYTNGGCSVTVEAPEDSQSIENITPSKNGMISYNHNGTKYLLANTYYPVLEAVSNFKSNKICQTQSSSFRYDDQCLCFAEEHAYRLMTNNSNLKPSQINKHYYSGKFFKSTADDNKQKIINYIYEDLTSKKIVILHVAGRKNGTSRHYVTVIGFKQSVTSASTLKDTDLLILDSDDALIEQLYSEDTHKSVSGQGTLRFMNTGKMCNKDYSGYQIYRWKGEVKN